MMKNNNVGLIVLNYNDYKTTIKFLDIIKKYKILNKIIVVDNNSTNDSFEQLKRYKCNKIHVIKSNKNGGYGYGNNFGLKYAEKFNIQYIFISNPDVICREKTMINLLDAISKEEDLAAITCKMIEKNGDINDRFAWKLPTYKDNIIQCFHLISKILRPTIYNKNILKNTIIEVDVIPGSFFLVRADVLKKINYFDERTFLFYEEEILAYKIKKNNFKIKLLCNDEFIHNHSVTINKYYRKYIYRYNILGKSKEIYIKDYLLKSNFKINLFIFLFNISKIEVIIMDFFKSIKYRRR